MAEIAPSAGGGGGNRTFLLIIGGLAALLFIGLLALGAIFVLPGMFGGQQVAAGPSATPTRIVIPPTPTRTPPPTATLVVVDSGPQPTLAPGERRVTLEVDANQNVILTTLEGGKPPRVQNGTWSFDAASGDVTLTFTDINGKPFKDIMVVRVQENSLVPVAYNRALHGDLNTIALTRLGEPTNQLLPQPRRAGAAFPGAQATATPMPVSGQYGGSLPGVGENERLLVLVLSADGSAALNTAEWGKDSILQLGTWTADGNTVTVNLTDRDGSAFEDKLILQLTNGDLVGTQYDQALHGANLVLKRDPASALSASAPAAGTYSQLISLAAATPIPITATPIFITATPTGEQNLPETGAGEDLLLLLGGALVLVGVIVVVRRMRAV